jgi:biotin carboxylase
MEECILAETIMIIGAGDEQVPAYKLARSRGYIVIGTDLNIDAPGLRFADHVLIASTRDAVETARQALALNAITPINGVMTIANDVPLTVATVAEALDLKSVSLQAALNVSDKLLMKRCFSSSGVACPWFTEIFTPDDIRRYFDEDPNGLFVVKPVDGRGARGVLLIDKDIDPTWAIQESISWGDSGRVIMERFVPGLQLSTESFLINGKCFTPAIAERNYSRLKDFLPNIIEDGGTIPATLDTFTSESINSLILRGAAAVGITEGIVKGDLIIDEDGQPLIIELAARLSGGWLATHQIRAATGVDLVSAVMEHALGHILDEQVLIPSRDSATAIRYWYPQEGKIVSIQGEDRLKQLHGLVSYGFFRKAGDFQPKVRMHPDRFGYVIVRADTRKEALALVDEALSYVDIKVDTHA